MRFTHLFSVAAMQAVIVTDPYLIADVLGKNTEIEKSVATVYSKFNVVRDCSLPSVPLGMQVEKLHSLGPFSLLLCLAAAACTWEGQHIYVAHQ